MTARIQNRGGRRWGFWGPDYLGLHAAVLLPFLQLFDERPMPVGSDALIVDLVQPRLAVPRVSRHLGKRDRGTDAPLRQGQRAARAVSSEGQKPSRETTPKSLTRAQEARRDEAPPEARPNRLRAPARRDTPSAVVRRDTPSAVVRRDTPSAADRRVLAAMASFQPSAAVPLALARDVARHLRAARDRQARSVAAVRAGRRRAKRALARLTAVAHASARRGDPRSRRGVGLGASDRVGLRFYLSGRRVLSGKIVDPPQPRYLPPTTCRVDRLGIPPATVRMLVGREGEVPVAYIKHSSGDRGFDRCALRHAKGMRFRPGRDASGTPLDVWIHLRIEPSLRIASSTSSS